MPDTQEQFVAAWLEALREPERQQVQGKLRRYEGFCCLGILCDVAEQRQQGIWVGEMFDIDGESRTGGLPSPVANLAGLTDENCTFQVTEELAQKFPALVGLKNASLIQCNDILGFTFAQIADIIEARPPGLFKS